MKLIDANRLRDAVLALPNCYNGYSDTYDKSLIIGLIDEQIVVDAVPVVRCGECKYIGVPLFPTDDYHTCKHKRAMLDAPVDGFCCWGERRTDETKRN